MYTDVYSPASTLGSYFRLRPIMVPSPGGGDGDDGHHHRGVGVVGVGVEAAGAGALIVGGGGAGIGGGGRMCVRLSVGFDIHHHPVFGVIGVGLPESSDRAHFLTDASNVGHWMLSKRSFKAWGHLSKGT